MCVVSDDDNDNDHVAGYYLFVSSKYFPFPSSVR